MLNLAVHIVTSGLYKAKPNLYWRLTPQAASVPLQYNPIFLFLILQEFEAMILKRAFIISTAFLSLHSEISFSASQLDRDVYTSCMNYKRLYPAVVTSLTIKVTPAVFIQLLY